MRSSAIPSAVIAPSVLGGADRLMTGEIPEADIFKNTLRFYQSAAIRTYEDLSNQFPRRVYPGVHQAKRLIGTLWLIKRHKSLRGQPPSGRKQIQALLLPQI